MATRSQGRIRRDINVVRDSIENFFSEYPVLASLRPIVISTSDKVNLTWRDLVDARIAQNKEAAERDQNISQLMIWVRSWRPLVLLIVPGAAENLKSLPAGASTVGAVVQVAIDTRDFIVNYKDNDDNSLAFAEAAITDLGTLIEDTQREDLEAQTALLDEERAEKAFRKATEAANPVIVQGSRIIRAIFGSKSSEYKRLIARNTQKDREEEDDVVGKPDPTPDE